MGDLRVDFDLYAGVSVGALISAFLAQCKSGEEVQAARALKTLFERIENGDIWSHWWPFKQVSGAWKPSFLDSSPLERLVRDKLDPSKVRASGKKLRIGAVSLTTGKYEVFDEQFIPLPSAVLASASFPAFFKPVRLKDQWWSDGGVKTVTPLLAAIKAGATDIISVTCSPRGSVRGFSKEPNAIEVALRAIELQSDEIVDNDIKMALMYNELVAAGKRPDKRHVNIKVIRPKEVLNEDSLQFKPAEAMELQLRGYKDAVEAMS
jgi:NTE family protein